MKKVIKIAASTAVAASAFVAVAPTQQADAATNVNQLATNAQNAGTVLKWAISYEGSADFKTRPFNEFNAAKKAVAAAEAAAAKISTTEKLAVQAKLVDTKIQIVRATAYIDALTSSEKIKADTAVLDAAIKTGDIQKVEDAYHKATREYRKQAALLDRVYGQTTRDGIRNAVKPEIEKLVASVKNEVTVHMLAKAADADIKASKFDDASKKIAEAQAILDANTLTWETSLQKSINDVATSLPLSVRGVTRLNDTTVVVTLSKPVSAVYSSEFTFDNSLVATSAVLAADNKTVTLTTTKQAAGKTYTLSYKGTSATFATPSDAPGNITLDGAEIYSDIARSEAITATFKDDNGKINQAPVTISVPTGLTLVSVNGVAAGTATTKYVPNSSGQLNLVVKATGTATVLNAQLKYTQGDSEEVSQKLNFYADLSPLTLTDSYAVSYVDPAGNFFIAKNSTTEVKIALKSTDILQVASVSSSTDFKSKLSVGDVVVGTYNGTSGSSVLNLFFDKPAGFDFSVNEDTTVRVDSTHVTFTGKGEANKIIAVYGLAGNLIKQGNIGSNGVWSIEVPVASVDTTTNQFYLAQHTNLGVSVPQTTPAGAVARTVVPGEFTITNAALQNSVSDPDNSLNGDSVLFSVSTVTGDTFKLQSSPTITVRDGDGSVATFKHNVENTKFGLNAAATQLTVKFGYTAATGGSTGGLQGGLSIIAIDGVTNQAGLKVKTSALTNLSGY
ncbi:hypothetical protein SAMN05421670_2356 [Psychrobacillus psychrotolerans]|uniref:SbsC C-terminal domain-containing protein n=1 Tax=Psychrobacillus psychrotolerans TaxID=126156 RepID=A0A1I5Z3Z6_9BACI|nr:hypothetical protein [Psychrobacillus psychrotolerans]SFQ51035.1 hypothetical protein SAMN05421670_2356 [Psychrobacillus psychrotolerans]